MKRILLLSVAGIGLSFAGAFGLSVAHASMFEPVMMPQPAQVVQPAEAVELVRVSVLAEHADRDSQLPVFGYEGLDASAMQAVTLEGTEVLNPETADPIVAPVQVTQNTSSGSVAYPTQPGTAGTVTEEGLQALWLLGVFR